GWATVYMDGPSQVPFSAANINPSCSGQANGSVDLTFGFSGPYGPSLSIGGPGGNVYNGTPASEPFDLTGLLPGDYTVVRTYNPVYFAGPCQFVEYFTIPDLGVACGTVSGDVFIDNNQNCTQEPAEPSLPYRVLEINPGPQYAITDGSGHYTRNLSNGSYNLVAQGTGSDLYPICPPVQPVNFSINNSASIIDLADSSLVPLDVRVMAGQNAARVGFVQSIWGEVRNLSAQVSGAITLTVTFDPAMSYINASPAPTDIIGNVLTWSWPSFAAYDGQDFNIQLQVPADIGLLGQSFVHAISVSQPLPEANMANNSVSLSGTITAAYDPNDKTASTSSGWSNELYFIDQDEWIDYTIRFQNTGMDTAFTVVVTDTMSAALDLSTYEQGPASHPFAVEFKNGRVVEWRFANILLPDSNTNEPASHGLVSFRIKP
ncbi:MAG TPA: hypothetical protein PK760_13570, partial [Flavobacteriales bacterium]|nr:hypothetical protein [Flavobacteriales bacterium]